jgi:outer membrane receptor protein involved in Fe transport
LGSFRYGFIAIAIRGVAQNDFISNQESPVSLYVDEVYISQMSGAGFLLFDMERVEILRGPQGTLFGRNATATSRTGCSARTSTMPTTSPCRDNCCSTSAMQPAAERPLVRS